MSTRQIHDDLNGYPKDAKIVFHGIIAKTGEDTSIELTIKEVHITQYNMIYRLSDGTNNLLYGWNVTNVSTNIPKRWQSVHAPLSKLDLPYYKILSVPKASSIIINTVVYEHSVVDLTAFEPPFDPMPLTCQAAAELRDLLQSQNNNQGGGNRELSYDDNNFKHKYIKYKQKYMGLKNNK